MCICMRERERESDVPGSPGLRSHCSSAPSQGGDKAHQSHHILGWNRPSPQGLGRRVSSSPGLLRRWPWNPLEAGELQA